MAALKLQDQVMYRPPGPGLRTWLRGVVVELLQRGAVVRPAYPPGADLVELPRHHIRPAVARIAPPRCGSSPAVVTARRVRADRAFTPAPQPKPLQRIEDPAYLAWVRSLSCCACGPSEQRTQTQPHHYGPRAKSRKTHDWLTVPLCWVCHHEHWHRWRTLPGLDEAAAELLILTTQVQLMLQYFAGQLREAAGRWQGLADLAEQLPAIERPRALRLLLDLLVAHLAALHQVQP